MQIVKTWIAETRKRITRITLTEILCFIGCHSWEEDTNSVNCSTFHCRYCPATDKLKWWED